MSACSKAFFKEDDPSKACLRIDQKPDGGFEPVVCIQCGKCESICPRGAISQNAKGVYRIDKELCLGCGSCDDECPFGIMVFELGVTVAKCTACGLCVKACPNGVLEIFEK